MTVTPSGALFAHVDRAAFAAALAERLHRVGLRTPLNATQRFTSAMVVTGPMTRTDLYWLARLSFVTRHEQIATFDRAFAAIFGTMTAADPAVRRAERGAEAARAEERLHSLRTSAPDGEAQRAGGVPWATLPSIVGPADETSDIDDQSLIPERLASPDVALASKPFDLLDEQELRVIGAALERSLTRWPQRVSRRTRLGTAGTSVAYRPTLRRARRTGGEVIDLVHERRRTRLRPVVAILDLSGSMEPFARSYLHVMRALAISGHAEVFAFATRLTRLTAPLRHHLTPDAIERASDAVGDRFGGTRLATSLGELLRHPKWSAPLRGGVVVIVSDGADTDDPADLARRLARISRLVHRLVWVNPRVAADRYQPLVGGMAAALPFCDVLLPGNTLAAVDDVIAAITQPARPSRAG